MKNTLLFAAIVAAAGIGIGASADASATSTRASKNDCVWTRSINDFTALDRNKVVIWGPGRRAYLVELSMPLPELKFANRLAFVDRNHDGMLCGFGMDRIVVADSSVGVPHAVDDPRHDPPGRCRDGAARRAVRRAPVAQEEGRTAGRFRAAPA